MAYQIAVCRHSERDRAQAHDTQSGARRARRFAGAALLTVGCVMVGCSSTKTNSSLDSPFTTKPKSTGEKVADALNPKNISKSVSNSMKSNSAKTAAASSTTPTREAKFSFWPFKKKGPDAEFYVSLAHVHEQAGNVDGALTHYQKALDSDKNYVPALVGCAHLYDSQGQKVKAADYYARALKAHPKDASIANDLGLCYARQGNLDEALKHLEKAVELEPERALFRNNIATVLVELNRVDEAVSQVAKVYGEPVAHYNVGVLLEQHGNRQVAAQQFRLALQKDPGLEQAREWLAQLESAPNTSRAQMASAEIPEERSSSGDAAKSDNPRARLAARPTGAGPGDRSAETSVVAEASTGPSVPPSPEQASSYANGSSDLARLPTPTPSVKPLPPAGNGYVPPSRY